MIFIEGDLLDIKCGILCQQVNCQGVMGAGLSKQVRDKWPEVFDSYQLDHAIGNLKLGHVNWTYVGDDIVLRDGNVLTTTTGYPVTQLAMANLCGQYLYKPRGINHTNYNSLAECFHKVKDAYISLREVVGIEYPIYIPYKIGCGLAGGEWQKVLDIIKDVVPDATIIIKAKRR